MIILCDVDDVVADLMSGWLAAYNDRWGDNLTPDEITDWDLTKFVHPTCGDQIYEHLADPELYKHVFPHFGALWVINALRRHVGRVVFVSSANAATMAQKVHWLERYGFLTDEGPRHRDLVYAHDKALVRGDILIDDRESNLVSWPGAGSGGMRILFARPWNCAGGGGFHWHHGTPVQHARSWVEIGKAVVDHAYPFDRTLRNQLYDVIGYRETDDEQNEEEYAGLCADSSTGPSSTLGTGIPFEGAD